MPKVKVLSTNPKVCAKKMKPTKASAGNNGAILPSASDDEMEEISRSLNDSDSNSKKSLLDNEEQDDFHGGMNNLLEKFNTDLNKTMSAKKRKLEQFMQEFTKSTAIKVLESNKRQSFERKQLMDQFQSQVQDALQQGDSDMEKLRDADDKFQKMLIQQQKSQQVFRNAHAQRLKSLKNLSEEFCKGMSELETHHVAQYKSVDSELKKEMALLQKKILMDIQQQEMMNVRKQLRSILPS